MTVVPMSVQSDKTRLYQLIRELQEPGNLRKSERSDQAIIKLGWDQARPQQSVSLKPRSRRSFVACGSALPATASCPIMANMPLGCSNLSTKTERALPDFKQTGTKRKASEVAEGKKMTNLLQFCQDLLLHSILFKVIL